MKRGPYCQPTPASTTTPSSSHSHCIIRHHNTVIPPYPHVQRVPTWWISPTKWVTNLSASSCWVPEAEVTCSVKFRMAPYTHMLSAQSVLATNLQAQEAARPTAVARQKPAQRRCNNGRRSLFHFITRPYNANPNNNSEAAVYKQLGLGNRMPYKHKHCKQAQAGAGIPDAHTVTVRFPSS